MPIFSVLLCFYICFSVSRTASPCTVLNRVYHVIFSVFFSFCFLFQQSLTPASNSPLAAITLMIFSKKKRKTKQSKSISSFMFSATVHKFISFRRHWPIRNVFASATPQPKSFKYRFHNPASHCFEDEVHSSPTNSPQDRPRESSAFFVFSTIFLAGDARGLRGSPLRFDSLQFSGQLSQKLRDVLIRSRVHDTRHTLA